MASCERGRTTNEFVARLSPPRGNRSRVPSRRSSVRRTHRLAIRGSGQAQPVRLLYPLERPWPVFPAMGARSHPGEPPASCPRSMESRPLAPSSPGSCPGRASSSHGPVAPPCPAFPPCHLARAPEPGQHPLAPVSHPMRPPDHPRLAPGAWHSPHPRSHAAIRPHPTPLTLSVLLWNPPPLRAGLPLSAFPP